jgi:isoaspartyl peptidase/L-asparaginase-like protein (Ntn-hydrolase superfamily)
LHGGAVVGEERARKATFLERLTEAVDERLRGFLEVPLEVAADAAAIVECGNRPIVNAGIGAS